MSELSTQITNAKDVLEHILQEMGFAAAVSASETDEQILLTLTSEESLGLLIGKGGQTLDALELIVRQIVQHRTHVFGKHITLDAEGYRERHAGRLTQMAQEYATKVLESGEAIELEPMSPRDRRTIHMVLADIPEVSTYSRGEEPGRFLVICLPGQENPD
jgi:spoIIIJ-associated protein